MSRIFLFLSNQFLIGWIQQQIAMIWETSAMYYGLIEFKEKTYEAEPECETIEKTVSFN